MKVNEKIDINWLNQVRKGNEPSTTIKGPPIMKKEEDSLINQNEPYSRVSTLDEKTLRNLSEPNLTDLTKELNKFLSSLNRALKVEIDRELKEPVFKIIDLETEEVIRQIPLEEILKLRKALSAFLEKYGALNDKDKTNKLNPVEGPDIRGLLLQKEV